MLLRRHYQEKGEETPLPALENKPEKQDEEPVVEVPKKRGRPKKTE